jgi:hypothetical protein
MACGATLIELVARAIEKYPEGLTQAQLAAEIEPIMGRRSSRALRYAVKSLRDAGRLQPGPGAFVAVSQPVVGEAVQ